MASTTITAFWDKVETSTLDFFNANETIFGLILGAIIAVFLLIGLSYALTYFFKRRTKR